MENQHEIHNYAARLTASIFGVFSGIGGMLHGVGEVLQGNVTPEGIYVDSWTQGPIAAQMGGDPGITLVPNMLVTGILALVVSLGIIVWSVGFVGWRRGGLVLMLLNVALLLVGGGVGPIVIGLLAGAAGTGIHSPYRRWRRLPGGLRRVMAGLWPVVFGVSLLAGLLLFVVAQIVIYVVDLRAYVADPSDIFLNLFFLTALSLLVTVLAGVAYDIRRIEHRIAV